MYAKGIWTSSLILLTFKVSVVIFFWQWCINFLLINTRVLLQSLVYELSSLILPHFFHILINLMRFHIIVWLTQGIGSPVFFCSAHNTRHLSFLTAYSWRTPQKWWMCFLFSLISSLEFWPETKEILWFYATD